MSFSDLAAMIALTGDRFRQAGLNPPRMVLTPGDYDKLRAMMRPELLGAYDEPKGDCVTISGVRLYPARSQE